MIPILFWWSLFRNGKCWIPISKWWSPFWYGETIKNDPHIVLVIPVSKWQMLNPHIKMVITVSIWGDYKEWSPYCFGDPCFETGIVSTHFDIGTAQSLTHIKTGFISIPGFGVLIPKKEWIEIGDPISKQRSQFRFLKRGCPHNHMELRTNWGLTYLPNGE